MLFETNRIRLRKMTVDDIQIYNKWSNDENVIINTYPNLDRYSLEDTGNFYKKITTSDNSKTFIIEEKDKKTAIGITTLLDIDFFNRNAEFIIDICEKDYWGKGYATEVLKVMLDYTFKELNLHRIYLKVFSFNKRAIKLYEKFGFKHEGNMREALYRDGKWHDIIFMGLLQKNYLK
ncbi:GNAT family N-acetyltransferase [Clostridium sp. D2Q-14]|uniref:GNAT family N-acetyltransferase n=1 Tax=Anaeromonas gelatinilytica TaxID=2683194 RepID=UPI00193C6901|nr:GNAT family protein [Anaeromonas gelatinilytica]MBS4536506.1 GNAT family N-acetyltransferase [Anaeromonas gelatinilytica]